MSFLLVLVVVILAYGVFQRALLFMEMNTHPSLIFQLLYKPFLLMFGELNVEDSRKLRFKVSDVCFLRFWHF